MSLVYWGVLLAIISCGITAEKYPKTSINRTGILSIRPDPGMAFILSSVLIFVSGFRYRVGTDFMSYYRWHITDWSTVLRNLLSFRGGGFPLLAKLSRTIWNDGQSVIFFSALVIVGLYSWTIYRQSNGYLLSVLLYLFLGQWQGSFNGIRQYIAAGILFTGYHYIHEKNFLKYGLIIFVASLFHASAIVMVLPCFLFFRRPDLKQLLFLACGAVFLFFSYDMVFNIIGAVKGKAMILKEGTYRTNDVNPFRIAVAFIPLLVYIVLCDKEQHTKEQDFYINAIFFNAFAMLAGMGSTYLARIGIYTNSFLILAYGYLFQLIRNEKSKRITVALVLTMYFFYWVYSIKAGGIESFQWYFNTI